MARGHMDPRLPITAVVAVKNEASNISQCLASLRAVERILVVDSGSTDGTPELALAAGAEVLEFRYRGGFPKKRQWTIQEGGIRTDWVLLIDADEALSEPLVTEIRAELSAGARFNGYFAKKEFHFLGRRLRFGGFSHEAVVLFRQGTARFERLDVDLPGLDMEVHERLIVDGPIGRLRAPLLHEDRKGLEKYIERHNAYSTWESLLRTRLLETGTFGPDTIKARLLGNTQERRRFLKRLAVSVPGEAAFWFCYHYFLRLGMLDGRRGLIAARLRSAYIRQVRAKMFESAVARDRGGL